MRAAFYYLVIFINSNNIHDVYWNAATIILKNIEKISDMNIVEVADMCYVSTATISRLCRKLNYESFIDFKADVIRSLEYDRDEDRLLYFDEQIPDINTVNTLGKEAFKNHFDNIQNTLQSTFDHMDYKKLLQIVDMMQESKRVYFLGNYFTQSCANQLQIELSQQGKECFALYPISQQKEILKQMKEGDLIIISTIAGSIFRTNPDIVKMACRSKAKVITISQIIKFEHMDKVDLVFTVGNERNSLVGKFSITYVYELLELIYHVKYKNLSK